MIQTIRSSWYCYEYDMKGSTKNEGLSYQHYFYRIQRFLLILNFNHVLNKLHQFCRCSNLNRNSFRRYKATLKITQNLMELNKLHRNRGRLRRLFPTL